jgi:membrane associated rhomboid family serine protease
MIITSNFSSVSAQSFLFSNYGAVPNLILSGQNLFSLFSSMFLHGSIAHLLGNMFFLYVFGDNLEGRFGHYKYLLLYLLWGVIASFAHSIYAVSTGDGSVAAVGASGAISGVLGGYLIFFPRAKIHTIVLAFFITTIKIPALAYIPFWFILQLVFALIGQSGGVAYFAHIGGFVAGIGTAYFWKFFVPFHRTFNESKINKTTQFKPPKNDLAEEDISPEVLLGNGFLDVIIQQRGIVSKSDIQTKFNSSNDVLSVKVPILNKAYSVQIPKPENSILDVTSISVINGIIRIRLENAL